MRGVGHYKRRKHHLPDEPHLKVHDRFHFFTYTFPDSLGVGCLDGMVPGTDDVSQVIGGTIDIVRVDIMYGYLPQYSSTRIEKLHPYARDFSIVVDHQFQGALSTYDQIFKYVPATIFAPQLWETIQRYEVWYRKVQFWIATAIRETVGPEFPETLNVTGKVVKQAQTYEDIGVTIGSTVQLQIPVDDVAAIVPTIGLTKTITTTDQVQDRLPAVQASFPMELHSPEWMTVFEDWDEPITVTFSEVAGDFPVLVPDTQILMFCPLSQQPFPEDEPVSYCYAMSRVYYRN